MPTTLTLKNIPDALYERLKISAAANRRSLNSEALMCLEEVLLQTKPSPSQRLARARALRDALDPTQFAPQDIDTLKQAGRA